MDGFSGPLRLHEHAPRATAPTARADREAHPALPRALPPREWSGLPNLENKLLWFMRGTLNEYSFKDRLENS